MVKELP